MRRPRFSKLDQIAYKFLKIMEIEVNFLPWNKNFLFNPNFSTRVATELTEKIFTPSEQAKVSSWIEELRKKDPSLIERARAETKKKIAGLGDITSKVFEKLSDVAWKFFGLIEVEKKHFSEIHVFFSQMLNDLKVRGGKKYQSSEVKEYFLKGFKKLEELVENKKKSDAERKTSTDSTSESNKTDQIREEKNDNNHEVPNSKQEQKESNYPPVEENLPPLNKNEFLELVRKGEDLDDPVELKKIIGQIERLRGEKIYESLKPKISILKKKLASRNFKEYCSMNLEMIGKELKEEKIEESELETETQKKLEKLRKGEINQAETEAIKNKVSDEIKLKGIEKKLKKLLKDYQSASRQKKKELLKQIIAFINSDNFFYQKVYQQRKSEIDSLLKNSDSSPLVSTSSNYSQILVSGAATVGIVFILIKFFKNRKRIPAK
ncbi:MAG: hypothetical protein I3273_00735 [Candidatus Moeniiplasma glomeromycotorum]|nr:hypothetical protein [Candidatus Moeniiplasma glomeromycotorum]MCE8167351.1 hypothetical protein [Candidatus Moeniiplasma glomeromycotorum]MCE8168636.1 hypothetical protein [Candidatus Moeniiplasma glomeromycotorum]